MTMAEQMARAIFAEWVRLHPNLMPDGWGWDETKQATWLSLARVCLEAQREAIEELRQPTIHYAVMKQMLDTAILEAKTEEVQ